jgi:hypothetical protein
MYLKPIEILCEALKDAIGDKRISKRQGIFSENEEKISYDDPPRCTDPTGTSHIYEAIMGNEVTLSCIIKVIGRIV